MSLPSLRFTEAEAAPDVDTLTTSSPPAIARLSFVLIFWQTTRLSVEPSEHPAWRSNLKTSNALLLMTTYTGLPPCVALATTTLSPSPFLSWTSSPVESERTSSVACAGAAAGGCDCKQGEEDCQ